MKTKARFTLPSLEVMILAQNRWMNVMNFALLELSFILLLHTKTKQNPSLIIGDCLRKIINHPPEKVRNATPHGVRTFSPKAFRVHAQTLYSGNHLACKADAFLA